MNRLVLDPSVALAWCFPDESDACAPAVLRALRSADALVPAIWPLEVANALLVAERSKRLAPADAARFLALLDDLDLRVDPPILSRTLRETRTLAKVYGLSSYDAAYLELAMREGVPLATLYQPPEESRPQGAGAAAGAITAPEFLWGGPPGLHRAGLEPVHRP